MIKVTYKNKAGQLVKIWFETTDAACQYLKTIIWNVDGYAKVEAFEEVEE